MTTQTWKPGITGNWSTASNWTPGGVPGAGDRAVVNNGTPQTGSGTIVSGVSILLGGLATGQPVTLQATELYVPERHLRQHTVRRYSHGGRRQSIELAAQRHLPY